MKLTIEEACQFLYREARYMDTADYEAWLGLWADDGVYWVPCNDQDADPSRHIALVYADRAGMTGRLRRLQSGDAYTQDPPSRMSRVVSNVEVEPVADNAERALVHSTFNLTEVRRGEIHTFAGRSEHELALTGGEWQIARKKVVLVNLDDPIANLSFLV
jgi:3-phenylpropionate/cinnamic acid dioxygenase small subunit